MLGEYRFLSAFALCLIAAACGSSNGDALFNGESTGGGGGLGSAGVRGGPPPQGGGGSTSSSGGAPNGGAMPQGGFGSGPVAGGAPPIGGSPPGVGGTLAMGGVPSTGAVTSSGGATSTGGKGAGGKGTGGAPTCTDSTKNGAETAADCGGGACPACPNGSACLVASDCQSLVCLGALLGIARTCRAPTCSDNVKNATETDMDCGGAQCTPCANGKRCLAAADCASKSCVSGVCTCQKLTCADIPGACGSNVSDGCGGTQMCPACSTLCTDMKKDASETAVDCGGPDCKACPDNSPCLIARDCQSGICKAASTGASLTCRPPACNDRAKNGAETDVDCGGGTCAKCAPGFACKVNTDCAKGPCNAGVCGCTPLTCDDLQLACGTFPDNCSGAITCNSCAALCQDQAIDGNETDLDCGGPDCPPCDPGLHCLKPRDCASGSCTESGGAGLVCGALPP